MVKVVGNKVDLVHEDQIEGIQAELAVPWDILTSAKTGENVEGLFTSIGESLLSAP